MHVLVENTQPASSAWASVLSKPLKWEGPITHVPSFSCHVPQRQKPSPPSAFGRQGWTKYSAKLMASLRIERSFVSSYAWIRPEPNMLRSLVQPASLHLYSAMP